GNSCQLFNIFIGHRQFDCLPPPCHAATPRSISTNEESTKGSPVPRPLVSWNRSSSSNWRACVMLDSVRNLLMRNDGENGKLPLAEGLSQQGSPRCVTTAFTTSNPALQKLAISSPRAILAPAREGSRHRKMRAWRSVSFREPSCPLPAR